MKILFCPCHYVFDSGERGSELSWAYNIANNIASINPESVVVTGFKNVKEEKTYEIVELQKDKKFVDLGIVNAFKFNFQYSKFAYFRLKKENFDIIHHVLPFGIDKTYNMSFLLGNARRIPKIIGPIQNQLPFYKDNIYDAKQNKQKDVISTFNRILPIVLSPLLKYLSLATLKSADKIIVINQTTKKMLLSKGVDAKKIVVIPPGIDCERLSANKNKIKIRIEILSVGTLIERKGFDLLIKAVSKVIKTHKNIIVRIVGDGPQKDTLLKLVRKLSLEKYIVFEGLVPHHKMKFYYRKADMFVSMSRFESWGQMYLEAMASGLPIVSSRNAGSESIIQNGIFGYLIPQGDCLKMAKTIIKLIKEPDLKKRFGKIARLTAEKKYDWNNVIIPKYIEVYKSLLREK